MQGCASVLSSCTSTALGLYSWVSSWASCMPCVSCSTRIWLEWPHSSVSYCICLQPGLHLHLTFGMQPGTVICTQFRGTTGPCMLSSDCLLGTTACYVVRLWWDSTYLSLLITMKAQFWRHTQKTGPCMLSSACLLGTTARYVVRLWWDSMYLSLLITMKANKYAEIHIRMHTCKIFHICIHACTMLLHIKSSTHWNLGLDVYLSETVSSACGCALGMSLVYCRNDSCHIRPQA